MRINEQVKIKANFWNRFAIAAVIAGFKGDCHLAVGRRLEIALAGIFFGACFRPMAVGIAGLIRDD